MKNKIDEIDERIIYCLRKNGRITMKELGDMVHLSGQAAKKGSSGFSVGNPCQELAG